MIDPNFKNFEIKKLNALKHSNFFIFNLKKALTETDCSIIQYKVNYNDPNLIFFDNPKIKQWFTDNPDLKNVTDILTNNKSTLKRKQTLLNDYKTNINNYNYKRTKNFIEERINSITKFGEKIQYAVNTIPIYNEKINWNLKNNFIEAFTDGSLLTENNLNKSGWGVFFEDNHPLNQSCSNVGINSVFQGELNAILFVLLNTPLNKNIRIYSDSQSAISLMESIIFHIKNNFRYKSSFSYRWTINSITNNLITRFKKNSIVELYHIYSHIEEKIKLNNADLTRKIFEQKRLYGSRFNDIVYGNEKADKLAKLGAKSFVNFKFPKCNDKYFLINNENNSLVYKKIQNELTKKQMYKNSLEHIKRLEEKWDFDYKNISEYSFNFNEKINWKDIQALEFLTKLRQQDLKLKCFIFDRLDEIDFNRICYPHRDYTNSNLWYDYWNTTYKDPFCEFCKHSRNTVEDFDHFLSYCPKHTNRDKLKKLQDDIVDLIWKIGHQSLNSIPNFFSTNRHNFLYIPFPNKNWNISLGMLGFIPNEFIQFLKNNFVSNIKELIFNILIKLGHFWKQAYRTRCEEITSSLNAAENFIKIFGNKKKSNFYF